MYQILSWIVRYLLIALVYYFIYSIIRLIYLDIKAINEKEARGPQTPYLKLVNRKERLDFEIEELYDLVDQETTIGRGKDNHIQILDQFISTRHGKITIDEGAYFLEDLGSVNGTYLNGEKIHDVVKLRDGDRIGLGQIEFLFVKEED